MIETLAYLIFLTIFLVMFATLAITWDAIEKIRKKRVYLNRRNKI